MTVSDGSGQQDGQAGACQQVEAIFQVERLHVRGVAGGCAHEEGRHVGGVPGVYGQRSGGL